MRSGHSTGCRRAKISVFVDYLETWPICLSMRAEMTGPRQADPRDLASVADRAASARARWLGHRTCHLSLKRWEALRRFLDDGAAPNDNNWVENQIRP